MAAKIVQDARSAKFIGSCRAAARPKGGACADNQRWNQGDPDGFLELTSGDVVYFDPALGRKLIGKKPSESTTARSGAKSGSTRTG